MRLAVVVPMFNEEAGAGRCIDELTRALACFGNEASLIVVDDGSTDATLERLAAVPRTTVRLEVLSKQPNEGYGRALRTGARHARTIGADWVLFMDSDLTNPPTEIPAFVDAMSDNVDLVKACRYCPGGGFIDVPVRRRIFSRAGNVVARLLAGGPHRDPTNGFRAVRTEFYLAMPLMETGFSVILEELFHARRLGARGADVPSVLHDRAGDLRPSSFSYSPHQLWSYLRWPLRMAGDRVASIVRVRR